MRAVRCSLQSVLKSTLIFVLVVAVSVSDSSGLKKVYADTIWTSQGVTYDIGAYISSVKFRQESDTEWTYAGLEYGGWDYEGVPRDVTCDFGDTVIRPGERICFCVRFEQIGNMNIWVRMSMYTYVMEYDAVSGVLDDKVRNLDEPPFVEMSDIYAVSGGRTDWPFQIDGGACTRERTVLYFNELFDMFSYFDVYFTIDASECSLLANSWALAVECKFDYIQEHNIEHAAKSIWNASVVYSNGRIYLDESVHDVYRNAYSSSRYFSKPSEMIGYFPMGIPCSLSLGKAVRIVDED